MEVTGQMKRRDSEEEEQVMSEVHLGCPPGLCGPHISHFTFSIPPGTEFNLHSLSSVSFYLFRFLFNEKKMQALIKPLNTIYCSWDLKLPLQINWLAWMRMVILFFRDAAVSFHLWLLVPINQTVSCIWWCTSTCIPVVVDLFWIYPLTKTSSSCRWIPHFVLFCFLYKIYTKNVQNYQLQVVVWASSIISHRQFQVSACR